MRLRKYQRCEICGARTEFPRSHFLDFHYGREKNAASEDTV